MSLAKNVSSATIDVLQDAAPSRAKSSREQKTDTYEW